MGLPLITKTELVERVIADLDEEGYELTNVEVKAVIASLEEVAKQAISNCERVKIGNLIQLEPKLKKAQKARMGRNPQTGEDVKIGKKPASVRIAARVLKAAKDAAPTVNLLKRRSA